jgi:hypothetical protein
MFLQGRLDESEKYLLHALEEAKQGFGEKDPHVASSLNNLVCSNLSPLTLLIIFQLLRYLKVAVLKKFLKGQVALGRCKA